MKFDFAKPEIFANWLNYRVDKFPAEGTKAVLEVSAVRVIEIELQPGEKLTPEQLRDRIAQDFQESVACAEDAGIESLRVLESKP